MIQVVADTVPNFAYIHLAEASRGNVTVQMNRLEECTNT